MPTRARRCGADMPIPIAAERSAGARGWFTRHQGWLFFPLLLLEGLSLHTDGLKRVLGRDKVERRWVEGAGERIPRQLACLRQSPPEIATWSETHPGLRVTRIKHYRDVYERQQRY